MNYLKVYCNLIRKAENRTPPEDYIEKHHTFPKGIFGKNSRIVIFTPREHYIAHLLLEKICIKRYGVGDDKTRKMTTACVMMRSRSEKYNSHLYEEVRKRYSQNMKKRMEGENNPSYGVPCSEERKQKIRETKLGKKHTQDTKNKMSKIRKGADFSIKGGKNGSKKTNSQKWMCLETNYITTSGALTHYQRKRGIDTSKRKQIV
jgi:hypothetical protein